MGRPKMVDYRDAQNRGLQQSFGYAFAVGADAGHHGPSNDKEITMSNQQTSTATASVVSKPGAPPSPIEYIHHLKFPVADVDTSVAFYEKVFGAQELTNLTHKDDKTGDVYARVVQIPGFQPMVELWINSAAAKAQAGYDFLTLAVKNRDALNSWSKYLDDLGIEHSGILTAIDSWLLVFEDPDGHRMRLYSLEDHAITHDVSTDKRWLG
jgi:catechol 2,3-dioxygenase-like lactoylglutathione lyase family enzyme